MIAKRHRIVVEGDDATNYSAYSPDIPGVVATGATREECARAMRDAIEFHLEGLDPAEQAAVAPTPAPVIEFWHVSQRFNRRLAVLEDVSLQIDAGEFVGVWGPRRSGKSTLLRLMTGVELPSEGTVRFEGRDIAEMSATNRSQILRSFVGFMSPLDWSPSPGETVVGHVVLASASDTRNLREARRRALDVLDRLGIGHLAAMPTISLRPGERVRVMLARALIREPSLLVVDEPSMMGGTREMDEFVALLKTVALERCMTLVVASETLAALRSAKVLMSLENGKLRSEARQGMIVPFPQRNTADG
jgi:ABC-type lipoprotein export system ATPase subunit/predicted RNase H-like HicB family nuclease